MRRIALSGPPGAGKSTLASLLGQEVVAAGEEILTVKVGAPLYEAQSLVHALAGRPLLEGGRQDGVLLNFLGAHMRRINPDALTEAFARRVEQAEQLKPRAVLLCDDLRAPDVEAVTKLGFVLVEVSAPEAVRRERRRMRGDLSLGDEKHPTEEPVTAVPWRRVDNDGSLASLRAKAAALALEILR
ncbi:hypothetical protein AB0H73_09430 [Streptomyces olivoreticuli]